MKIEAKMLSKESLLFFAEEAIKRWKVPEELLARFYRNDLVIQVERIRKQLKGIENKLSSKKISRKEYQALCAKEMQLVTLGNKKIKILNELDHGTTNKS